MKKNMLFYVKIAFFGRKYLQNKEKVVTLQAYSGIGTNK
jgi:hypothetical protein